MKKSLFKNTFMYLIMIGCIILFVFPVYWIFIKAINNSDLIWKYPPEFIPKAVTFENLIKAERLYHIGRGLMNTFVVASLSVIGATLSSALVAYGFARMRFKGRDFLFAVILASMMIPWDVTLIPRFIEFNKLGLVNSYLPLILPLCFGVPFYIFLMRQFIMGIPYELDESAIVDGCNRFTVFTRIIVPLLKPAVASVVVYQFLDSWNDFINPLVYLSEQSKYTMTMVLFSMNNPMQGWDWPSVFAGASVAVILPVIIFFSAQRYLTSGIVMTGLKS